jgi:hypothetical protein
MSAPQYFKGRGLGGRRAQVLEEEIAGRSKSRADVAGADSLEDELGKSAAVTDVGRRSKFRADVAEDAALGRMSRGDAMKAFSRFDELTAGGSFTNKARPSATSFSRQPAAGGLRENWEAQKNWSVNSFTNNASQVYSQAWWDRSSATFGHTGFGGAREPGVGVFGGEKAAPAASPSVSLRTPGFGDRSLGAFADRMGQFSLRQSVLDISRDESWKNILDYGERTFETPDTTLQNPSGADDGTKDPLLRKAPWEGLTFAGQLSGGR